MINRLVYQNQPTIHIFAVRRASSPPPGSPVPSARPRDSCAPPRRSDRGPTERLTGDAGDDVERWVWAKHMTQNDMHVNYIVMQIHVV